MYVYNYKTKHNTDFAVATKYRQTAFVNIKVTNPFGKTGRTKQLDDRHFEETKRGEKIIHY